jgi:hypothetical protein
MKRFPPFLGLVVAASVTFAFLLQSLAQDVPPPTAASTPAPLDATITVNPASLQPITAYSYAGISDRIGLQSGQVITVMVQFAAANPGDVITAEPLDGGQILGKTNQFIVASDGTITFQFQACQDPGVCQVSLHNLTNEIGLQFWVLDPNNPDNNPPVVN